MNLSPHICDIFTNSGCLDDQHATTTTRRTGRKKNTRTRRQKYKKQTTTFAVGLKWINKSWGTRGRVTLREANKDVSPDVHGLHAVRQLVHEALVLQRAEHDDGGFGRSRSVVLWGGRGLRPHVGHWKHTAAFTRLFVVVSSTHWDVILSIGSSISSILSFK